MKMKAFLMFVLLFLCSMGTKAQDLGANYNENIDYPITEIRDVETVESELGERIWSISPICFFRMKTGMIVGVKENAIRTQYSYIEIYSAKKRWATV